MQTANKSWKGQKGSERTPHQPSFMALEEVQVLGLRSAESSTLDTKLPKFRREMVKWCFSPPETYYRYQK